MDMNIKNGKLKLKKNNIKNGGVYLLITVVVVVTIFVTVADVRSTITNALPVVLCKITSALVAVVTTLPFPSITDVITGLIEVML